MRIGKEIIWPLILTSIVILLAWISRTSILLFVDSLLFAYIASYSIILGSAFLVMRIWSGILIGKGENNPYIPLVGKVLFFYGFVLLIRAYMIFRNYGQFIDLSYYESAVLQLSKFQIPKIWDIGSPLWSQHFEPILFLFVPWYWMKLGGSRLLVLSQAALGILGGVFAYRIALDRLKRKEIALGLTALYLCFGGLQSAYLYGFHPIALFPFFFLSMAFWYERKQYGWYALLLLLSLFVKEEISFVMIAWGLWLVIGKKDLRVGIPTMASGALWYFLSFHIIGYFHHGGYEYWGQFGGGAAGGVFGIIGFALRHPILFVSQFFDDARKLPTLIEMFGSFGFLPFLSPLSLIMLIPSLLLKLLSHDISMLNSFHYSAEITPLLFLSSLEGIMVVLKKWKKGLAPFLLTVAILSNMYYGFAFYYGTYAFRFGTNGAGDFLRTSHSRVVDRMISQIPKTATVSCEYAICSHLVRPYGQKLPIPHPTLLEYVILDPTNLSVLTDEKTYETFVKEKIFPAYDLLEKEDGVLLFKRTSERRQ